MRGPRIEPKPCDIAIVGIACSYSQARTAEKFWNNIVNKVNAIREDTGDRVPDSVFDPTPGVEDKIYCKQGGWLGSHFAFNPLKYGTMPRNVEGAEPDQFLVLRTVFEAMEDAGYLNKNIDGKRVSVIVGRGNYLGAGLSNLLQRGIITQQTLELIQNLHPDMSPERLAEIKKALRRTLSEFGAETAPGLIPNITTGRVANRLDFMGKNLTVDAACASSLIATELGIQGLIHGQDDMVLVGGVHVFTHVPFLQVFAAMRALSASSTIRPFDADCDGTIPGEGVGILVLKRLEDAEEAGDRIYAVIKGIGSSSDGKAKSVTAPRVEGEELAVRRAYETSGISPETIELIEGHGTGTPVGDAAEIETLHRVFGTRNGGPPNIAVGSIKSMIGHAMPAAGAAGIIKTALALYHRVLPPTLNVRKPTPELVHPGSPFYVNTETRPWIHSPMAGPRRAGIDAFGFGGVNAHMILEEYKGEDPAKRRTLIREWESELIVLEGETREKLQAEVSNLRQYVTQARGIELRDIAYTRNVTLASAPYRVSVVATSLADLQKKLERVEQRLNDPACKQIKDSLGIYYFQDTPLRGSKIALMFPGEGSQYLNMLSDLCMHFPEVRECFDVADEMIQEHEGRYPPSADIFPAPFFSKEEEKAAEQRLWQIQRATEAVLTADGAIFTLLERLGLKSDMMVGHSAGEWIAMAASGILDVGEFLGSFSRLDHMYRGLAEDTSIPRMVMLAVGAGRERVEKLVGEIDCTVHIANDNCPNQVVVVVEPAQADRVLSEIQSRGIFVERLAYDRGYHTSAFTYICEPLRKYFSEMAIHAAHTPVYCCTTAQLYPDDSKQILDHVANTFARPLVFRQTIESMYEAGARIFVEAGPRGNLAAFVDDILRGKPHLAVAIDQYRRPPLTTLNNALGLLTALHVPLDLNPLYVRRSPRMLTGDAVKDRIEDRDSAPGTMQVPLGYPRLSSLQPLASMNGSAKVKTADSESPTADLKATRSTPPAPVPPAPVPDVSYWEPPAPAAKSNGAEVTVREQRVQTVEPKRPGNGSRVTVQPAHAGATILDSHFQLMESFLETQEAVMSAFLDSSTPSVVGRSTPQPAMPSVDVLVRDESFAAPVEVAVPSAIHVIQPAPLEVMAPLPANGNSTKTMAPAVEPEPVPPSSQKASPARVVAPDITDVLLKVVSDRTGYPVEMLGLDLDMEAELGIDSIKRVEILSALQQFGGSQQLIRETAMEEVARLKTLRQVLTFLDEASGGSSVKQGDTPVETRAKTVPRTLTANGTISSHVAGEQVTVVVEIDPDEHVYLVDHSFVPVVSDWDLDRAGQYFVPLTVSLAAMAEVAAILNPDLKVVGAKNVQASKWIDVIKGGPKVVLAISAKRTDERRVAVKVSSQRQDGQPGMLSDLYAEATIVFAPDYATAPPAKPFDLVNPKQPICAGLDLYSKRRMFHGPRFQGVVALDAVGENGLLAKLDTLPRNDLLKSNPDPFFHIDPFLFDAVGQLVGYWPVEYCDDGFVLFPIRVEELILYREPLPPGQRSVCQMRVRNLSHRQLKADLDVIAPDGKLWMQVIGWEDWRFYWQKEFYDFWRFPNKGDNAMPVDIRKPEKFSDIVCRRVAPFGEIDKSMWESVWAHIILSSRELIDYRAIADKTVRARWMRERGAIKDVVRAWIRRKYARDIYPADVEVTGENDQVMVAGHWVQDLAQPLNVSVATEGPVAVAAVDTSRVGVEIEAVVHWEGEFEGANLQPRERALLTGNEKLDRDEWLTRLWCAKKAAAKTLAADRAETAAQLLIEHIEVESGDITVNVSTSNGASHRFKLVVSTARDGDCVIALAARDDEGRSR